MPINISNLQKLFELAAPWQPPVNRQIAPMQHHQTSHAQAHPLSDKDAVIPEKLPVQNRAGRSGVLMQELAG